MATAIFMMKSTALLCNRTAETKGVHVSPFVCLMRSYHYSSVIAIYTGEKENKNCKYWNGIKFEVDPDDFYTL